MTTKQIIDQMEKELYEFIASSPPNYPSVWKSLIRSRLRTLLESFGEEILGKSNAVQLQEGETTEHALGRSEERGNIRLKVKEILQNIK